MQNTNIITTEQTPNTISASNTIFNVQALTQLQEVAGLMSQATVTIPITFEENLPTAWQSSCKPCNGHEPLRCGSENTPGKRSSGL